MLKKLKNTDINIFPIILGSDYYGSTVSEQTAFDNMDLYIKNGGNLIDTARMYVDGKSEETIGSYIAKRGLKNKLFISTKAAYPDGKNLEINRLSREEIEADTDKSLKALGVDVIDILWLHRDDASVPVEQVADAMDEIVKKGKIRYWGVSNWTAKRLDQLNQYAQKAGKAKAFGSQIQWSLAKCCNCTDPTLVAMDGTEYNYYSLKDIPVFAYASQGKGFFEKYHTDSLSPKAKERYLCDENIKTYELLKKISTETGYSLTALGLAYLMKQPEVDTFPLIGCTKTSYVSKAMEALTVDDDTIKDILKIKP